MLHMRLNNLRETGSTTSPRFRAVFYTRLSLSSTDTDEVMVRLRFGNLMAEVKAVTGSDE